MEISVCLQAAQPKDAAEEVVSCTAHTHTQAFNTNSIIVSPSLCLNY